MNEQQVHELLYEALETELGGVQVYQTALRCAQNEELKEEWEEYLEQTENHVEIVQRVFERIGLDPEAETPGRKVVRHIGQSLVRAMEMALEASEPAAAELVACECVVLAETKAHLNWELIGVTLACPGSCLCSSDSSIDVKHHLAAPLNVGDGFAEGGEPIGRCDR